MIRRAAIAVLACLLGSAPAVATTPCPLPKMEGLRGAWLGEGDAGAFARLEIDKSGVGLLTVHESPIDSGVSVYRVTATKLSGYTVGFAVTPVGSAVPTALTGEAKCGLALSRLVRSPHPWSQEFQMRREDKLQSRIRAVQRAADAHRAKPAR